MKKLNLFLLAMATIIFCSIVSCKKYENGPSISLRSAESRVSGDWSVTFWSDNNEDCIHGSQTDFYTCTDGYDVYYTYTWDYTNLSYTFNKNGQFTYSRTYTDRSASDHTSCNVEYVNGGGTENGSGSWELQSKNTKLQMQYNGDNIISTYDIKELRESEMMLEGNYGGSIIKMTFEKK